MNDLPAPEMRDDAPKLLGGKGMSKAFDKIAEGLNEALDKAKFESLEAEVTRLRARVVELEQAAYADSYVRGALEHVQEMWHRAEKEFALDANDPYEAIASLRAELATHQWLPISTAPYGVELMGWGPRWESPGRIYQNHFKAAWQMGEHGYYVDLGYEPTHWMPMPAQPADEVTLLAGAGGACDNV